MSSKAKKAPDTFDTISKKSPFLVDVKTRCANSIKMPNRNEEIKINIANLILFIWFL